MNLHLTIGPIVSLIAGILILVMPRLLNYIVAIYLITIGLLELFGSGSFHLRWSEPVQHAQRLGNAARYRILRSRASHAV